MFQDFLFYGTDVHTKYAFRMCNLSGLVKDAAQKHGLNNPRAVLLGDVLLGGVLLSSLLEDEERINLRVQLGGDFTIASETTRHAEVKGYFEADPTSPFMEAVDEGCQFEGELFVRSLRSKASGESNMFEGVTKSFASSIEEAINHHLQQSYQIKARLRLETWVDEASGALRSFGAVFLELPHLEAAVGRDLWDHVSALPSMKSLWEKNSDPDFLARAMIPHELRAIRSATPTWHCTCSQQAVETTLRRLAHAELQELIEAAEPTSVRCHYCGTNYLVSKDTLRSFCL
jgi:molecular chaperone Hsp33